MAFLPLSLPFFLFFFLNIHFLQTQKQHATTRMIATKAMETMAQFGTEEEEEKEKGLNFWGGENNISETRPKLQKVITEADRWKRSREMCLSVELARWRGTWVHAEVADYNDRSGLEGQDVTAQLWPI